MHITLFQVNMDRDEDRLAFCSLDTVKREAGAIPAEIYDKVFEGDIDCANLEEAYMLFNRDDRPGAKVFRSMSVSDVIAVRDPETGVETYHFCDSVGFEVVDFDPEKTTDRTNREPKTIRVVLVEPGKEARLADVDPSLEGLYSAIKTDLIEAAYPFEDDSEACIVCDEEGKIKGRDLNRADRPVHEGEAEYGVQAVEDRKADHRSEEVEEHVHHRHALGVALLQHQDQRHCAASEHHHRRGDDVPEAF